MTRTWKILFLLPLLFFGALATAEAEPAACGHTRSEPRTCGVRPQDTLWMISTREVGCPDRANPNIQRFRYRRYDPAGGWQEASDAEFLADARERTVIHVHGNRIDGCEVFERGMAAYRALTRCADDQPSIRFVVWSWPSTRICGPRRDALAKADRADVDSYYLAEVLGQLPPDTRLGLFGFSLGSRVISGALHLAGGGDVRGHRLPTGPIEFQQGPSVALVAAALHRDWWLPHGAHDRCPQTASSLLVLFNPLDPILKLYPRIDRQQRSLALGLRGFPWPGQLGGEAAELEQQNASRAVGRTHDELRYFASPWAMSAVRRCVLGP